MSLFQSNKSHFSDGREAPCGEGGDAALRPSLSGLVKEAARWNNCPAAHVN